MIDWNNDGRIDPTEVVLTDIILGDQKDPDTEAFIDSPEDKVRCGKKGSRIRTFFRKRKDVGK